MIIILSICLTTLILCIIRIRIESTRTKYIRKVTAYISSNLKAVDISKFLNRVEMIFDFCKIQHSVEILIYLFMMRDPRCMLKFEKLCRRDKEICIWFIDGYMMSHCGLGLSKEHPELYRIDRLMTRLRELNLEIMKLEDECSMNKRVRDTCSGLIQEVGQIQSMRIFSWYGEVLLLFKSRYRDKYGKECVDILGRQMNDKIYRCIVKGERSY